jgi:hypothetical protein
MEAGSDLDAQLRHTVRLFSPTNMTLVGEKPGRPRALGSFSGLRHNRRPQQLTPN